MFHNFASNILAEGVIIADRAREDVFSTSDNFRVVEQKVVCTYSLTLIRKSKAIMFYLT